MRERPLQLHTRGEQHAARLHDGTTLQRSTSTGADAAFVFSPRAYHDGAGVQAVYGQRAVKGPAPPFARRREGACETCAIRGDEVCIERAGQRSG